MKSTVKKLAAAVLGEYALYQIWQAAPAATIPWPQDVGLQEVTGADLLACEAAEFRDSAWYLGEEACGFGAFRDGRMLALVCCQWGARYAGRRSWPLPEGAAKIVHIVTLPAARGLGLAPVLIQHAESTLREQGRAPLLARIWHSNAPSMRAFKRAGWQPIGWLALVNPLRRKQPWRLTYRT